MRTLTKSILFLTAVLMSTTGEEDLIYAQVGDTVTLKPPEGNNLHKYYLYWLSGGQELAWRNNLGGTWINRDKWNNMLSLSGDSLIIRNIQQEHFGTFDCKLTLNHRDTIMTYRVLKLNVTTNSPSPLLRGETLSLICSTESPQNHKRPEIRWMNPQGENVTTSQGLHTVRATVQDNGQWTCVVTNKEKKYKAKISVAVVDLYPTSSLPYYTSKFSRLTIPCSIPSHISWEQIKSRDIDKVHWDFFPKSGSVPISGEPQTLFSLSLDDPMSWKAEQNRGLTPVPYLKKGNLSLTRNQVRDEDRGDYVCTLKFRNGLTLNRTAHIHVLKIISSLGTDLISGQQVNLTCSLGHLLSSDLRVKWVPPKTLPLPSDDHPHLTILSVGKQHGGMWKCELWQSNTQLTSAVITLKIAPKLSVWMLVIICSVTVIVILLLILAFTLYRRRQRKMRHLRHRLCQCKNPKPKGFYRT